MQIVINSYGSYIRKRGECFEIKVDNKKSEVSARKIQTIIITTHALISTDAILLAHENNIDIIFLDHFGNPFSRVWHSKFGSTNYIRRKQLEISENKKGLSFVIEWISNKIDTQIELLKKLQKTRKDKSKDIDSYIKKIKDCKNSMSKLDFSNCDCVSDLRNHIFAIEGKAGKLYFETLQFIIPPKYKFSSRSRNPAKDEFNAFLNYGYGVLYSKVERACIICGLDPYIGFLHTDNYGKKSFVFDIIELFRTYVDEIVIKLFSKRMVKRSMCDAIKNGVVLNKDGKQLLILSYNEEMEKKIRYRNRNIKKKNVIEFECHRLANIFIKD